MCAHVCIYVYVSVYVYVYVCYVCETAEARHVDSMFGPKCEDSTLLINKNAYKMVVDSAPICDEASMSNDTQVWMCF